MNIASDHNNQPMNVTDTRQTTKIKSGVEVLAAVTNIKSKRPTMNNQKPGGSSARIAIFYA
jgi:hypothetical protein